MGETGNFRINEDGSVTRIGGDDDGNKPRRKNGCFWTIVVLLSVALTVGLIALLVNLDSDDGYVYDEPEVYYSDDTEAVVAADDDLTTDSTKYVAPEEEESNDPAVTITGVWLESDIYSNGDYGMNVHVSMNVDYLAGETLREYVMLYYANNTIPVLLDGDHLKYEYIFASGDYDSQSLQTTVFIPYSDLNYALPYGTTDLSFDVAITTMEGGILLGKWENYQFSFSKS